MKEAYMRALSGEEPNQSWTMEEMLATSFVDGSDVPAQMKAVGLTAEGLAERRMVILNTWRNTSDEPVGRCPSAVADQRTIKNDDGCDGVVGRVGLVRREGQQFYFFLWADQRGAVGLHRLRLGRQGARALCALCL